MTSKEMKINIKAKPEQVINIIFWIVICTYYLPLSFYLRINFFIWRRYPIDFSASK